VVVAGLVLELTIVGSWARDGDDEEIEFSETASFFEYNPTDKDLGLQIFFGADGWKEVAVRGPEDDEESSGVARARNGSRESRSKKAGLVFEVANGGSLREIGSTEVFTESEEPELCGDDGDCSEEELQAAIDAFLAKFPEGT